MSAIAIDGARVYVGAADGGVWRSTDDGDTWTPLTDDLPTTSTGALAVNPDDHSVWLGTGEANTAFENYLGTGIYRSDDYGDSWVRVGGDQLKGTMVARIVIDGERHGVRGHELRHLPSARRRPHVAGLGPGAAARNPRTLRVHVLQRRAGHAGNRRPRRSSRTSRGAVAHTDYNGFYVSNKSGDAGTWKRVRPNGIDRRDIGRASFAYSADGSKLYALVESIQNYNYNPETALMGVYVSDTGDVAGPWTLIADNVTLATGTGSALTLGDGYSPGIQAWYNQFIGVDPERPRPRVRRARGGLRDHRRRGHLDTVGPYWNFGLAVLER